MDKPNVIALIQARGGSKGVPQKNIRRLSGFPLLAYSVAACGLTSSIERTILSTDNEDIASIGMGFGCEVPFMRPDEYAQDDSTDRQVIEHAMGWYKEKEGYVPEYWIQIRPTTPLREPSLLDAAIKKIKESPEATSLVSIHEFAETPGKMFGMQDGYLHGLCPFDPRPEYFTLPRQAFPPAYFGNGYIDIVRASTLEKYDSCYGPRMLGFETPDTGEIDTEEDFRALNYHLTKEKHTVFEHLKEHYSHLREPEGAEPKPSTVER